LNYKKIISLGFFFLVYIIKAMPGHTDKKKKAPPPPKKITQKQRDKLPPGLIKAMEKKMKGKK
jgi:hypothetical protein|tara:strand:- start:1951 stop:2139 length:189 start_codon:yes stop_codon:yes gene_type:complete